MTAGMEVIAQTVTGAATRGSAMIAGLHLLDDFPMRPGQREKWAELCRLGAAVIGFLCVTSSVAALILAYLEKA
jgi:hypothetical protein